mmetsp:Transcript_33955/g.77851  ORF Transcript_33955/g.77851 Transcript_33955/m.77851 type:complete len:136 (+) Transcript_33955:804-1211(+)
MRQSCLIYFHASVRIDCERLLLEYVLFICITGAASSLRALDLACNRIGNAGVRALAAAFGEGSLTQLSWLNLLQNPSVDADGMQALTEVVERGSTSQLKRLWIDRPASHPDLLTACSNHGIRVNAGQGAEIQQSQ